MSSLAERVQGLPQEVFDQVYDLTFTSERGRILIDRNYTPPFALQIGKKSRQLFAKRYYSGTEFRIQDRSLRVLELWEKLLSSLSTDHRTELRQVHIAVRVGQDKRPRSGGDRTQDIAVFRLLKLKAEDSLAYFGIQLSAGILRFEIVHDGHEGGEDKALRDTLSSSEESEEGQDDE